MTAQEERSFGDAMRRLRLISGLTQDALADQVGCATQTIRKIELGSRRPSYQMAARIAQVLGLPTDQHDALIRLARPMGADIPEEPAPPPPATQTSPPRDLPSYLTAFIGREQEQASILRMLNMAECRLITLLGIGGIGKTRLATTIAERAGGFTHGVGFVSLVAITEPRIIPEAITAALGFSFSGAGDLVSQLLRELSNKALLLILDNIEHLLDPYGLTVALLNQILQRAPQVKLLVTSRERLRLQGEWVVELSGLPVPDDSRATSLLSSPAIQLFLERAQRVQHGFQLRLEDCPAIAAISRLVGGMPLGLELAAAWAAVLSPQEISEELARGLDDPLLVAPDQPARHGSLHAVFEHSWRLLARPDQMVLSKLAVFSGGCTREAAAEVAGAPIMSLATLVDKSLLRRNDTGRYELHEAIRQYALAKLQQSPHDQQEAYRRHSAYYAGLLRRSITAQTGGSSTEAWAALLQDIDNVRAAWSRAAASGDSQTVVSMARGMMLLYDTPGWVPEGAALFRRASEALRAAGVRAEVALGTTLGFEGYFLQLRQPAAGASLLEEAVALLERAGDTAGRAQFLLHLGTIQVAAGNFDAALARYEDAGSLAHAGNDALTQLWVIFFKGVLALYRGHTTTAEQHFGLCLDSWRRQQFQRGIASALNWLSEVARQSNRLAEAAALAREGLQISSAANDRPGRARSLRELGAIALAQNRLDEAEYLLTESCETFRNIGSPWVYGRSRTLLIQVEVPLSRSESARDGCAELLRLVQAGASILLPEVVYGLALVSRSSGDLTQALELLYALQDEFGEHATIHSIARLRMELEEQVGADQRQAAQERASGRLLLPWLTESLSYLS